jgi:hypothetical protein
MRVVTSLVSFSLVAAMLVVGVSVAAAQDWPQFRGRQAGVAADHADLPDTWSTTENVRWTTPIPGLGWSSPVVWGDHVFVTAVVNTAAASTGAVTATEAGGAAGSAASQETPKPGFYLGDWPAPTTPHRWMVYDVSLRTGAVRWATEVGGAPPANPKHLKNSFASETVVTDGERVYAYFGNLGLFAFDMEGRQVWSAPMRASKTRNNWGTGASPALHGGRVYIVNDNDEQSFLAAFDARTGREVWRVARAEGTNWATPFVWEHAQRTEIVTSGSDRVRSYGTDGKILWELTGLSTISIPTPFARHGLLYLNSGYLGDAARPALAIRPGAAGDISLKPGETANAFIAWALPTGAPYNPTPIVVGDYYYTLFDRGFFTSHDARTGLETYGRQRVTNDAAGFTASPWSYNGRIFAISEEGDTYVIQAGPEFKVLGKNSLGEMTLATPAVSGDSLIVRTASKLYRITKRARD